MTVESPTQASFVHSFISFCWGQKYNSICGTLPAVGFRALGREGAAVCSLSFDFRELCILSDFILSKTLEMVMVTLPILQMKRQFKKVKKN